MTIDIGPNLASTIDSIIAAIIVLVILSALPILCWRNRD
jgi:hypothetical protein